MLFFKKLLQTENFLFNETDGTGLSEADYLLWERQKEIISEINKFIFSFDWLKYNNAKEFMKEVVDCDFDYALICERTGRPYMSVRSTVSIRSTEAEKLVGVDTLDLLLKGNCVEAYSEFLVASNQKSFENYAIRGIVELLPKPDFSTPVPLEECDTELKFLKAVGVENFKDKIATLDENKLKYLLAILDGEGSYMSIHRTKIWQYLLGSLSYKDLMRILRD